MLKEGPQSGVPSAGGARLGKPLNFLLTFLRGRSRAKTTATFPPFLCLVKSGKVVVNGLPTSFLRSPPQFFQARWAAAEKVRGRNKGVFFFPDFLLLRRIQQVIRDDQKEDSLSSPPPIFIYYYFCLFHFFLPLSPDSHSRHLTWGIKRREKRRSYMISCRLHYHFNREGRTTIIALKQSQYPRLTSTGLSTHLHRSKSFQICWQFQRGKGKFLIASFFSSFLFLFSSPATIISCTTYSLDPPNGGKKCLFFQDRGERPPCNRESENNFFFLPPPSSPLRKNATVEEKKVSPRPL